MATTEWHVGCANGHTAYVEVRHVPPKDVRFADCPQCGAPRRGEQLDSNPSSERDMTDQALALLGKQVAVKMDEKVIVKGQLLSFGDSGEFTIRDEGGFVHYCWPILAISAADEHAADRPIGPADSAT